MNLSTLLLDKQKRLLAVGIGALIGLLLLFGIYVPLALRLKDKGKELSGLTTQMHAAQAMILSAQKAYPETLYLPSQEELSWVMDEVTETGKGLGIDFRSIHPEAIQKAPSGYSFMPVEMKLESSYKELGQFIGALRTLKKGFVTVERFEITRDEKILPKLNCRLLMKLILRPSNDG